METNLNSLHSIMSLKLCIIILLFSLLSLYSISSAEEEYHQYYSTVAPNPAAPTTTNPFDFIRNSCNATLYPDICFTSLSRYANYVRRNPAQLARIAIGVSLARARHALSTLSNMTHRDDYGPDQRFSSAIHDCVSLFGDTVDQIRGSLKQMSQLGSGRNADEAIRFQLSNVQTWMSAALTNEDTCSDGFQDVKDCPEKIEVCDKVAGVKEFTSNALALVNSFAASVG